MTLRKASNNRQSPRRRTATNFGGSKTTLAIAINLALILIILALGTWVRLTSEGAAWPAWILALSLHRFQTLVAIAVILLGGLAFWAKSLNQLIFGSIEVLFAAGSAWATVPGVFNRNAVLSHWIALVGTVYIAARGVGNIAEARTKSVRQKEEAAYLSIESSGER